MSLHLFSRDPHFETFQSVVSANQATLQEISLHVQWQMDVEEAAVQAWSDFSIPQLRLLTLDLSFTTDERLSCLFRVGGEPRFPSLETLTLAARTSPNAPLPRRLSFDRLIDAVVDCAFLRTMTLEGAFRIRRTDLLPSSPFPPQLNNLSTSYEVSALFTSAELASVSAHMTERGIEFVY